MQSQGDGSGATDHGRCVSMVSRRVLCRLDYLFRTTIVGMLCLVGWGVTHAQSTNYVYDANGRVAAVTASSGSSVQYSYNALGHASQISAPLSSDQLAVFAFTPTHGEAGTQVALQGQRFDPNPANDTVSFDGVTATVLSASATQLVAVVPSGAATGPVSVTIGNQTVTSSVPFVVDDTGVPPTINTVSPSAVAVGGALTITGAHLDPVAGQTVMTWGDRDLSANSTISDSQIVHTVTGTDTSGYITVNTLYGQAISANPVIVLPNGLSASNIVSSGTLANGNNVNLTIPAGGQTGAVLFDGHAGDWLSLQISALTSTAANIAYTVYAPGNQVLLQGVVSSASPSIHLPQLVTTGTYLVTITPDTAGAQLTMGYEHASVLAISQPATVVTSIPGQSKRMLFPMTVGRVMTVAMANASTSPSDGSMNYSIYTPGQQSYTSGSTSSSATLNLLPANSGTYQMIVGGGSGVMGSMQVDIEPGVQDTITANGQSNAYNGYVPGQNVNMTFVAQQGDNLELTLSGVTITGSATASLQVNVYNANGVNVASGANCYSQWTCRYPLWNLAAGTYTVVVSPPDTNSSITFNGMLSTDIVAPALSANTPVTVSLGLGQVERFTFQASAGDSAVLNIANASTSNPSGLPVTFNVYGPNNTPIQPGNFYTTIAAEGSRAVNLASLPSTGTYTVVVFTSGVQGTAQLTWIPVVPAPMTINGTNQAYSAGGAGQSAFMTFSANQGDNLELTLNNVSGSDAGSLILNVYDSNGVNIASSSTNCNDGWTCRYSLWNLNAGKYLVVVSPPDQSSTVGFDAVLTSDVIGPSLMSGQAASITLGLGQVERLTLSATAGNNVALNLSNANTSNPTGLPVYVNVYSPANTLITTANYYTTFNANGAITVNLQNLPVTGIYTLVVYTSGVPGTAQLTTTLLGTGALASNGANLNYEASGAGQNVYLAFNANQGDDLELTFSNVQDDVQGTTGASMTFNVFDASGTNVASGGQCYKAWTCRYSLWNLSAGAYTIVVSPPDQSSTLNFDALLTADVQGPVLQANTPTAVNLNFGQVERLTFTANAGDNVVLDLSNVTTSNPSGLSVYVSVYRPDVAEITASDAYSSFSSASSSSVTLQNLPVSGTYTIVVSTSGVAGSGTLELVPQ